MTSIAELFPKCRKLAYDARQQVALLSANGGANNDSSNLQFVLEELNRQLNSMEELVLRETPAQRTVWKRKIAELRQESDTLAAQGAASGASRQFHNPTNGGDGGAYNNSNNGSYKSEREELMRRRRRRLDDEGQMQHLAAESQSLSHSNTMVLDILQSGEQSYHELKEQRQRLRGVTRIVADIGNSLGLSQATMRIIERRDITDAYFVVAGMIITLIVLYVTWF